MGVIVIFVLCGLFGGCALEKVEFESDRPFLRVLLSDTAELKCCYKGEQQDFTWVKRMSNSSLIYKVNISDLEHEMKSDRDKQGDVKRCATLTFKKVQLNDTGLYQCRLGSREIYTHGTYLQVYKLMEKMINLSESTKNTILTAEGILLLLCVIVPSVAILFRSKGLRELEMKKVKAEEENIYQGLNLDDCCTTYDQIERSQVQGQYQDVCNGMDEREEIQLEKP